MPAPAGRRSLHLNAFEHCSIAVHRFIITAVSREIHAAPDRRARPRAQVNIISELRTSGASLTVQTLELSSHGAFVRTPRLLPVGSAVHIALRRGVQRNPLVLAAEVVRVGTPREGRAVGLALRFTDITPVDEASLHALLDPDSAH